MDLNQLRAFVTVADAENLTKAAERLFMTPPSLSAQIKALETELKLTLFTRTSRGMKLTEPGIVLKAKAEQTLQAAQALIDQAGALQTVLSGQMIVGLNATPGFLRIAPLTQTLKGAHPKVTLRFISSDSGKTITALQQGLLDAGYLFGSFTNPAICTQPVCQAELVIAAPQAWAAPLQTMDWPALAQLPWIYGDGYCPFQDLVDELFGQRGLTTNRCAVQSSDEATKRELIGAGLGLALLEANEAREAEQAGKLVIWRGEPIYCPLSFAYLAQRAHEPLLRALLDTVAQVWAPVSAESPLLTNHVPA